MAGGDRRGGHLGAVIGALVIAGALSAAAPAVAETSLGLYELSDGRTFILVSGAFDLDETFEDFADMTASAPVDFVSFDSPGGSAFAAMRLGRMIRERGLGTIQSRRFECASACAFAFAGGRSRVADAGSIGVHRSSFDEEAGLSTADAVQAIQEATSDVMLYLTEMGVDPGLMQLATQYDASDIRYLSSEEMAMFHLITHEKAGPEAAGGSEAQTVPTTEVVPETETAPKTASAPSQTANDPAHINDDQPRTANDSARSEEALPQTAGDRPGTDATEAEEGGLPEAEMAEAAEDADLPRMWRKPDGAVSGTRSRQLQTSNAGTATVIGAPTRQFRKP